MSRIVYEALSKVIGKYVKLETDEQTHLVYVAKDSIPPIEKDIEYLTDYELDKIIFKFPVIHNKVLFESSHRVEGFVLKEFKIKSIRKGDVSY